MSVCLSVCICSFLHKLFSWDDIFVIFVINLQIINFPLTNFMISLMCCTASSRLCTKSAFTMALFSYLCPIDNALDPQGPLSQAVPRAVIDEASGGNNENETCIFPLPLQYCSSSPTLARLIAEVLHLPPNYG